MEKLWGDFNEIEELINNLNKYNISYMSFDIMVKINNINKYIINNSLFLKNHIHAKITTNSFEYVLRFQNLSKLSSILTNINNFIEFYNLKFLEIYNEMYNKDKINLNLSLKNILGYRILFLFRNKKIDINFMNNIISQIKNLNYSYDLVNKGNNYEIILKNYKTSFYINLNYELINNIFINIESSSYNDFCDKFFVINSILSFKNFNIINYEDKYFLKI